MLNTFIVNLSNFIKFWFILMSVERGNGSGLVIKNRKYILEYSLLYVICLYLFDSKDCRIYLLGIVFEVLLFGSIFQSKEKRIADKLSLVCLFLGGYEIVMFASCILGAVITWMLKLVINSEKYIRIIFLCVECCIMLGVEKHKLYDWFHKSEVLNKKAMLIAAYFAIACLKIPFLYTGIRDALVWKMVFLTMICCTVVFMIVLRIDRQNAEKEKAWIEENNKILQTKLHKSKEILPAVVHALNDMTKEGKTEMEEQNTHKLLAEVSDLYGLQVKEDSKDDLRLKNFCSTGLALLDQQLKLYQKEALDRNVNLDIIVQAPIDAKMKKNNIDQLRLQRAVGDMIRNAFRAIEREERKCRSRGHILLIIGCQYEDILEIAVVDNGAAFPLQAVEAFGRRGITTGGTGNGLADLVEFAKDVNASIYLEEFPKAEEGFSKKLSIVFDRKERNFFKSSIREQIRGSFWSVIEL